MVISVDTGNKQIKTEHFVFQFGLNEMDIMPPKLDIKVLEYNGKFYTPSNRRIAYMKDKTIRLSGPKLGRKSSSEQTKTAKRTEYPDHTDRIAVEREFSVEKHSYGLGRIVTKLESTQLTSIALSVFVSNLFRIRRRILSAFLSVFEIVYTPAGWAFMLMA